MMYIYQNPDWHKFTWNGEKVQKLLFDIKKAQGYLLGKMDTLGFEVKNNAYMQVLTENIIKSSESARNLNFIILLPFFFYYILTF